MLDFELPRVWDRYHLSIDYIGRDHIKVITDDFQEVEVLHEYGVFLYCKVPIDFLCDFATPYKAYTYAKDIIKDIPINPSIVMSEGACMVLSLDRGNDLDKYLNCYN